MKFLFGEEPRGLLASSFAAWLSALACLAATSLNPSAARAGELTQDSAVAACKKHVESMLIGAAETRCCADADPKVQAVDGGNFDVSCGVTSKLPTGRVRKGDFTCQARHGGGSLWTTKTSLAIDP